MKIFVISFLFSIASLIAVEPVQTENFPHDDPPSSETLVNFKSEQRRKIGKKN